VVAATSMVLGQSRHGQRHRDQHHQGRWGDQPAPIPLAWSSRPPGERLSGSETTMRCEEARGQYRDAPKTLRKIAEISAIFRD
jgi:hypothetical protein